ncbi:MAG: proline--tRNA ligase [Chloroflexi bacterium]|nr:proline--tRNA ligase [Chloroflexota bacterium]
MRLSRSFGKTLRQAPADAETASHKYLTRAGFVQQVAAGIYSYLPLGWRSLTKISNIIREEMNRTGAQEVSMPVVQPRELWEQSGRADTFQPPLATLTDRRGRKMIIAPTHEETTTLMVAANLESYRDLPFNLYQIQTKFRDEARPRAGLLRVREFEMKDAYSFDKDEEGLDVSFREMADAYRRIFSRVGIDVRMVEADSGPIGGKDSNEFVLLADSGEDTIFVCSDENCGYAANAEKAEFKKPAAEPEEPRELEEVHTPGIKTIEALAEFVGVPVSKTVKAVFYTPETPSETSAGGEIVFVSIRGDLEVNETKLRNSMGGAELRFATPEEVAAAGIVAGSASAIGLDDENGPRSRARITSIADDSLVDSPNLVAGANRTDYHLKNGNYGRDFSADVVADIAMARAGDACPNDCNGHLVEHRGVEVGHIFKLGTRYSESMGATFIDEDGSEKLAIMGCYGIGIGRLLAATVEANHDDKGMILPRAIAPYEVYLARLNTNDETVVTAADKFYDELVSAGVEVLFDDRDEPPGVKFNDADLIGLPLRVVVSARGLRNGEIELKRRDSDEITMAPLSEGVQAVKVALEG